LPEILAGVVSYTESSKVGQRYYIVDVTTDAFQILLPVVEQFLQIYLPLWNGSSNLGSILDLMSFLPPQPFLELETNMLSTLEAGIFSGAETPFEALFEFYSNLAQRWMTSRASASTGRTPRGFLKSNALFDMIQHVSVLAESALAAGQPAISAVLSFYERLTDLITEQISQRKQILPPVLPSRSLVYSIASTSSLNDLSRLCALLVTYKRCFERQEAGVTRVYQANATDLLNGYLMDICNMIWRSRALNTTDPNAAGLLCPDQVTGSLQSYLSKVERDYSVHTIFDFSHSPMMAATSQSALYGLEEGVGQSTGDELPSHAGPVTQRSLVVLEKEGGLSLSWKQYRLEVLDWLENHGLDGMKKLIFATMKDLMK
jgi:centromere protein I